MCLNDVVFADYNEMLDDMHMALFSERYGLKPARVSKSSFEPLGEC